MTPEEYGLIVLYRRWSEDAYCAGWMADPTRSERYEAEFTLWLKEKGMSFTSTSYEIDALPTLRQCWRNAQTTAMSELQQAADGYWEE